jgi:nucleolar pre-ribosomal-associated protein 1
MLRDAAYDPCFILPFALHCLSSGWMMPDDFARKGLLAATLVSISSADEDMRKLGYEILAKYLTILEVFV